jgi:wyosine [tRNA(Phe)-imidazoG37] synthetase (radical SAM superfamily)
MLADFIQKIQPSVAYIAIPTRPTAFENIIGADEFSVAYAYHEFKEKNINVEHLTGYEGNAFASSGNFTADILSITAVHPMRKDAVLALMAKTNETEEVLNGLLEQQIIQKLEFDNQDYYLRKFNKKK